MGSEMCIRDSWNERTELLQPIRSGDQWCSLQVDEAIVATTNRALRDLDSLHCFDCQHPLADSAVQKIALCEPSSSDVTSAEIAYTRFSPNREATKAADLATFFRQTTGNSQPLLVLKRD